ncbi:MAG: glycosyltransferase family 4 protein [bacterium]
MRLLIFSFEYPPRIYGGLGTYALETTKKYVEFGHRVCVVAPNPGGLAERDTWNGVEVLRPAMCDWAAGLPFFVTEEFRRWGDGLSYLGEVIGYNMLGANAVVTEGRKFDVVVGHDWLGAMGAAVAARQTKSPFVFHVHSTEGGRQEGAGSPSIRFMEVWGATVADRVVTVSHAMKDEVEGMGVPPEKVAVAWNGVDAAKYDPARFDGEMRERLRERYDVGAGETMVLFVGRLTKVKGVVPLARAVPIVLDRFPRAKFVFLGRGELEGQVRGILREAGVESRAAVRAEFVDERERILHYAACDLAVFPSFYEPFGIVSLEAMAMGKPVVVGAQGTSGFREQVVTEGPAMCGVHVNPRSPEDIAWGIGLLMEGDMERLGRNARQRVLADFTWDRIASKTLDIYEGVTGARAGDGGV